MDNKEFVWTENLVREWTAWYSLKNEGNREFTMFKDMEEFKKSKQQVHEKEKEYDILTYINPNIVTDIKGGNIETANSYASIKSYPINSVRRISDNVVFSVGEKVRNDSDMALSDDCEIVRFYLLDGRLLLDLKNNECNRVKYRLHHISKVKERKALFTTGIDNVEIFHGDKFFTVTDAFEIVWSDAINGIQLTPQIILRSASTEEKAKEYILFNKPVLSLNDLLSVWDEGESVVRKQDKSYYMDAEMFVSFKKLANKKINNK